MITVSVAKREGLSSIFQRSFEHVSEAARFAESWLPLHVTIRDESGQPIDVHSFIRQSKANESALRPFKNADGSDALCPFCVASETPILADDELLHACETCERCWYVDEEQNILPADRCPVCESDRITVFEDGRRLCGACNHKFFFNGLTYVDPQTVESEVQS